MSPPGEVIVGAHVRTEDPLAIAEATGADLVQIFLGDPQSWKKPPPRADAEALKASAIPIYVHAPYLVNLASPNPKIRVPSRRILQDCATAAVEIGARAVIVHGGHVTSDDDLEAGFERWAKGLAQVEADIPILLENTAGGDHAMARHFDVLGRLWDHIAGDTRLGFCLDTCHAHAAGESLADAAERILALTGRIDLVHCNDSKDQAGSGRDRHQNIGKGTIDPDVLSAVIRAAGAPVVCETPAAGIAGDIAFVREASGGRPA
ncbi:MAG TPA: deoxyribonuclease IV [Acidimicrobiales bacterium]|nr:deoxyribonuclease IV [Acidimicrobiales bacterium]